MTGMTPERLAAIEDGLHGTIHPGIIVRDALDLLDEVMRLREGIEALATEWEYAVDEKNPLSSLGRALLMYGPNGLRDLLNPPEGGNDE